MIERDGNYFYNAIVRAQDKEKKVTRKELRLIASSKIQRMNIDIEQIFGEDFESKEKLCKEVEKDRTYGGMKEAKALAEEFGIWFYFLCINNEDQNNWVIVGDTLKQPY